MDEPPMPPGPRFLTVAPVREENPRITVITGLEGPLLPCPHIELNDGAESERGEGE